jgi:uncharacterized membrane protein YuzA (DUF378 family)
MWDKIALVLLILGGLNYGLEGLFDANALAWLFGDGGALTRTVYVLISLAAIWSITMLFRHSALSTDSFSERNNSQRYAESR